MSDNNFDEEQMFSMIYGNPGDDVLEECEFSDATYVGIIYEDLCPFSDFSFGNEHIILAKTKDEKMILI